MKKLAILNLSDEELEKLEKDTFEQIYFRLTHDKEKLKQGLSSKDKIFNEWIKKFNRLDKKKVTSVLARGAERIWFYLIGDIWIPNSVPIGSDQVYESHSAMIHIDSKTARINNKPDCKGVVPLGKNQTSYHATMSCNGTKIHTEENLPTYYKSIGKPTLTYALQTIYDHNDYKTVAVLLICIPNGQLFNVYKNNIVLAGKSKDESFRYKYSKCPYFLKLQDKNGTCPERVRFVYFNKKYFERAKKQGGKLITKKSILSYKSTNKNNID